MKWKTRLLLRSVLPLLPFQKSLRSLKRRFTSINEENTDGVLRFICIMTRQLQADGFVFDGKTALELGTGWEPQIPLILKLAGCGRVMTVDLHRLLDITSCRRTVEFLKKRSDKIITELGIESDAFNHYLNGIAFDTVSTFLESAAIDYLSPCDARRLSQPGNSVDLIVSNNVLEHIPPQIIEEIFREFHRVLRPGGMMAHTIDNCDHWTYGDRSISCVNFLQFEDDEWKRLQYNPIDFQNRLRHFEYLKMFADAGFTVTHDLSLFEESLLAALAEMSICERYRSVPHKELAIVISRIIAEKR